MQLFQHRDKYYRQQIHGASKRLPCFFILLLSTFCFLFATTVFAQEDKLSLTITPPLFQPTIAPGTDWTTTLRIVNTNPYRVNVHARVVSFMPDGETGNPSFAHINENLVPNPSELAGWIEIPKGDLTIAPGASYELPFTIKVPPDAAPGGHYAAILVGTRPPEKVEGGGAAVGTLLSALIFLRVPGDIIEDGAIRDFYPKHLVVTAPEQTFTLRFENRGNTHLVPQGEIVIKNMWGKERGRIVVNEKSSFGNVLPRTTRKFVFIWKGEPSAFDIGRYHAEAVLAFGVEAKQSAVRSVYFWIIPWKPVTAMAVGLAFFIWFFTWAIKRYVRRALALERERLGMPLIAQQKPSAKNPNMPSTVDVITLSVLKQPLIRGAADLRGVKRGAVSSKTTPDGESEQLPSLSVWVKQYRLFLFSLLVFGLGCMALAAYVHAVLESDRSYTVEEVSER